MSEHISIQEGGKSRNFGPANLLETETADGEGSCFWVPESDRELESAYIVSDGDYTPEKYAFSELHVSVSKPIGDFDVTIDDDELPHIDIEDPDIGITIDPNTGLPELTIDGVEVELPDISADIDINGDIDISLDTDGMGDVNLDISGVDLDGLDVNLSIDLDTLDIDVTELPDEIRIMHVPDKTSYKDGEEIDLDGIIVQAYRGGEVWEDKTGKYIDGYIPVHELFVNAEYKRGFVDNALKQFGYDEVIGQLGGEFTHIFKRKSQYSTSNRKIVVQMSDNVFAFCLQASGTDSYGGEYYARVVLSPIDETRPYSARYELYQGINLDQLVETGQFKFDTSMYVDSGIIHYSNFVLDNRAFDQEYIISFPKMLYKLGENDDLLRATCVIAIHGGIKPFGKVTISWPRPKDNKLLTASFDINVEESEGGAGSGGTHHSGTWGDDSTGHFGGTTISGDYGGSHHSGKF